MKYFEKDFIKLVEKFYRENKWESLRVVEEDDPDFFYSSHKINECNDFNICYCFTDECFKVYHEKDNYDSWHAYTMKDEELESLYKQYKKIKNIEKF